MILYKYTVIEESAIPHTRRRLRVYIFCVVPFAAFRVTVTVAIALATVAAAAAAVAYTTFGPAAALVDRIGRRPGAQSAVGAWRRD